MYLKSEELCKAIRQGKDVTENLAQIEPQLKHYYKERRKALQENRFQCANDSILHAWDALYDVSASVRRHWDMVYPLLTTPEGKYGAVLRFVNTRERFLGIPHTQSVRILRKIGWTSADIMAAYLWNRCRCDELTLSPDAVAEAVQEDMDTALRLMEKKGYDLFSNGYDIYKNFEWIEFMYFFIEYQDRTFLTTQHKSKRLCKYCLEVLKKLENGLAKPEKVSEWTQLPDFSIFEGITLTQKHLMKSAAGQHLRKGNDNNGYYVLSYHLVDEEHGYGAAFRFNGFNREPEYHKEEKTSWGVYFYRYHYLMLFDHVPKSWRCSPAKLPEDFVKKAFHSFYKLAGFDCGHGRRE